MLNAFTSSGIVSNKGLFGTLNATNTGSPNPTSFFTNQPNQTTEVPRAFINYIVFDEQFKYVTGGFQQVGGSNILTSHVIPNISINKNGYLFIYCSNESKYNVFFDNLAVTHNPGPILEETHYYPFGLTMSGISSKAAGTLQNKEKTFQGQQFDDDLGLNWVQFKWRNHDPQIGRFIEIDPLSEKYVYNSTYAFSENKVTSHVELEGLESMSSNAIIDWGVNKIIEWRNDLKQGAQNFKDGAVEKANSNAGMYSNQPAFAQDFHSLKGDLQMNAGVAQMVKPGLEAISMVASVAVGLEIPASPGLVTASNFGLKGSISLGEHATLGGLPNSANVVRGGTNTPALIEKGISTHPSGNVGFSVECASCPVKELSKNLPHKQIGSTTVGDIRAAGGDVIRTSGKSSNHATVTNLPPQKASELLTPTIKNPNH